VKLVDANVLLNAVDSSAPHHRVAKAWLDAALSGSETVILPWISLLAFVRLSTHPAVYPRPLTIPQALGVARAWTSRANAVPGHPASDHLAAMERLLGATGAGGNLVNDAHLAAIALAHGATVVTFDSDFGRFPGVSWETPT